MAMKATLGVGVEDTIGTLVPANDCPRNLVAAVTSTSPGVREKFTVGFQSRLVRL